MAFNRVYVCLSCFFLSLITSFFFTGVQPITNVAMMTASYDRYELSELRNENENRTQTNHKKNKHNNKN